MESALRSEVAKVALGYDLRYKITNDLMEEYLSPAYLELRRKHPDLNFVEFVDEVVNVRAQERQRLAG
jgi:hypothetical protein